MKRSDVASIAAGGFLAAGIMMSALTPPASATLDSYAYTYSVTQPSAASGESNRHSDFNWNWLGLEGLLGLGGLTLLYKREKSASHKVTRRVDTAEAYSDSRLDHRSEKKVLQTASNE